MPLSSKQSQAVESGGAAIQAGQNVSIVINQGVTPSEVRQLVIDVLKSNLLDYKGKAHETALQRGEEITDAFLEKLSAEHAEGIKQAETPDFQDALFTVQKEYAKAGDRDLGDLLVDLLVDRTKQADRDILQLVLNESLHIAPKLTRGQVSTLSVVFLLRHTQNRAMTSIEAVAQYMQRHVGHCLSAMSTTDATFRYLESTGCGSVSSSSVALASIFRQVYPGLFTRGFDQTLLDAQNLSIVARSVMIMPCLLDPAKFQVAALNNEVLEQKTQQLQPEEVAKLKGMLTQNQLSDDEIKAAVVGFVPDLKTLFEKWDTSSMARFELTSVGMAIGHANIKRITGEFAPLSVWIN